MIKKNTEKPHFDTLLSSIEKIQKSNIEREIVESKNNDPGRDIVDIITFCNDPQYLDVTGPKTGINLYLSQRVILKTFYMGTIGNENIKLNEEEWNWLNSNAENEEYEEGVYEKNIKDVIRKIMNKEKNNSPKNYFKTLHLVLGRRSSKCHEENQRISTTVGSITFKELCDRLNSGEKIGICTYNMNTLKRSITYDIKSEYNGQVECFELATNSGSREISSHNHPYYIMRESLHKPQFVQMSDLLVGDKICVAKKTELFGEGGIGIKEAEILGHQNREEIPESIYRGNALEVSAFICSLFDCDHILHLKNSDWTKFFKCRKTAEGIKHLLLKFGINSIIDQFENNFLLISENSDISNIDTKWDTITSITPVGIKKTIALEVKGTNIIGSDIISHNTFLASIISVYEAYKLLVINDGDPHGYYKLPLGDEIAIINIALAKDQAGRLFSQMMLRIRNSPFFRDKIGKNTTDEVRLLTKSDKVLIEDGAVVTGSIVLLCGHSNPDSLAGYNAILILFDEIAFFDEQGKVTGTYCYSRLKPSLAKFFDCNAAHIVQISSPNKKNGIFYDTFDQSKTDDSILSFQLPTWCVNPDIPYNDDEMTRDRKNKPEFFMIEYGAQWAEGGAFNNYFQPELIDLSVAMGKKQGCTKHERPMAGMNYYLHIDPARSCANYSAVLVAKEFYHDKLGRVRNKIYLANLWIWKPIPGIGLIFNDIDKEIIGICGRYHPVMVTYDDYQSTHSMQYLQSHGINVTRIQYNRAMKQKLYRNLTELMSHSPETELYLYNDDGYSSQLISELKNLKYKKITRGVSLTIDKNADVKTDDLADALAGACFTANGSLKASLPMCSTISLPWR